MRCGFTTGSCSAAAAKAACIMLLGGHRKENISIDTPSGLSYKATITEISIEEESVTCGVRKDSGDDPDITNGALILATVSLIKGCDNQVIIEGGKGVGKVTRPGLDQPVGNHAINSVPRMMIEREVQDVMKAYDYNEGIKVVISVPEGEELALKTFNPRLGIEGGISIIGTSGVVEPMSTKAILDTIRVELNQRWQEGQKIALISPGNYGLDFMRKTYDIDLDKAVKCSNYIGDTIDIVREIGYKKMILVGHIGKLIKISGGIMNTHSKEADCRMELLSAAALSKGADVDCCKSIMACLTTEEAWGHVVDAGIDKEVSAYLMNRIRMYLAKRATDELDIECVMYSNQWGLMGETANAKKMIDEVRKYI